MEGVQANSALLASNCEASVAGLGAFYQRKAECLSSILASKHEGRDLYVPKVSPREFGEDEHLELALAPWLFQSMPGARSSLWPTGLPEFVERLETLPALALWAEPLDILKYGQEFFTGAREFIQSQTEQLAANQSLSQA